MFTDPFGIFALFSLLPGYHTPAYRSSEPPPSSWPFPLSLLAPRPAPPSQPEIPANASGPMLILTEANDYIVPLMKEGLAGLFEDAAWTAHWHVFCADEKSYEWCSSTVKPASVCKRTDETLKGAKYGQGDYLKHVWLKWVLIRKALAGELGPAGSVLFLDADVAVLSGGRAGLEQCLLRPLKGTQELPHFQYQVSPYDHVNGGVLWFKAHQQSLDFVDAVYAQRAKKINGDDQAWANIFLGQRPFKQGGFRHRPLPKTLFHSFCMERQWHQKVSWLARTHHPTCKEGVEAKRADVRRARKMWHQSLMNATELGLASQDPCDLM